MPHTTLLNSHPTCTETVRGSGGSASRILPGNTWRKLQSYSDGSQDPPPIHSAQHQHFQICWIQNARETARKPPAACGCPQADSATCTWLVKTHPFPVSTGQTLNRTPETLHIGLFSVNSISQQIPTCTSSTCPEQSSSSSSNYFYPWIINFGTFPLSNEGFQQVNWFVC